MTHKEYIAARDLLNEWLASSPMGPLSGAIALLLEHDDAATRLLWVAKIGTNNLEFNGRLEEFLT